MRKTSRTLDSTGNEFDGLSQLELWRIAYGEILTELLLVSGIELEQHCALHLTPIALNQMVETHPDGFGIRDHEYVPPDWSKMTVAEIEESSGEIDYLQESAWKRPPKSEVGVAYYPSMKSLPFFEDFDCFNKWVVECMEYGPQTDNVRIARTISLLGALEIAEDRKELDGIMKTINYYHLTRCVECKKTNEWSGLLLTKHQSMAIKEIYICKVINWSIPSTRWFTTSDGTVDDAMTVWDEKLSAGGWNALDPRDEPDFQLRNWIERDPALIRQADITPYTVMDRGADFRKMLMRGKVDREDRFNRLKNHLMKIQCPIKRLSILTQIEARYYASKMECKKSGNNFDLLLTYKQLEGLKELNSQLTQVDNPMPF
jgi:hypothetical protein